MINVDYQRPPVRVALMGLGRAMFFDHYPVFKSHPGLFHVECACDLIKERRDIVQKDYQNCRMFRQFSDMLDEPGIDLVDIATCTTDHVRHATDSLLKGRWTLLETPATLNPDESLILKGAAMKAKNRLIVFQRGLFDADYLLAKQEMGDSRLGTIHTVKVCREDFVRRDDWQCVKRLGGGAAYYQMTDLVIQLLRLLPSPPVQMWSDLRRIASLGDAEDYARLIVRSRDGAIGEAIFNGGSLPENRNPSFEIMGERGVFRVWPGCSEGELTILPPDFQFPRRRSSVRTPPIEDMHEDVKTIKVPVSLPKDTFTGAAAFWRSVYDTVRTAAAVPITLDESLEAVKFVHLMKKTSPFGK